MSVEVALILFCIYCLGAILCGVVQIFIQNRRLSGYDPRYMRYPPPERSPYKPIEVWWLFSRGEFAAFVINCLTVPVFVMLHFYLSQFMDSKGSAALTGVPILLIILFISPAVERKIDGF